MSEEYNAKFRADTQGFIRRNFMTAVGIGVLQSGHAPFDLHHHLVNGNPVVRLDAWSPHCTEVPVLGYWVPQGGSCLIPANPGVRAYVFTPDFSGCSILVDQIDAGQYRVYHVQGGAYHLRDEYLGSRDRHGLGLAGAMTFDDYGDAARPRGFAFLKYENRRWWIYYQRQNGVGLGYHHGQLVALGPQTVRGGARVPLADLTREVPRLNARHSGRDLPITRNIRAQRQMLPNDKLW
jgi:hypothetical protein